MDTQDRIKDAEERIEQIDRELSNLYNVDFREAEREELRKRSERAKQLETERRRLQGWLNVRKGKND